MLLLSVPFFGLSLLALGQGFLSTSHAHLIALALQIIDRGQLELIAFSYPPLPLALATLSPQAAALSLLAALTAGTLTWLLWRGLAPTRLPGVVRAVLVAGVIGTPPLLFTGTQTISGVLTLLLLLVAWHNFVRFVSYGETWGGFVAGLMLGLGFYINAYAVAYALIFSLITPLLLRRTRSSIPVSVQSIITGMLVILFPALLAGFIWSYLNWLFNDTVLALVTAPDSAFIQLVEPGLDAFDNWRITLRQTAIEVLYQPLLLATGVIVLLRARERLLLLICPLLLVLGARLIGLNYPPTLAVGTYGIFALALLPPGLRGWWSGLLIPAAVAGVIVSYAAPLPQTELTRWRTVIETNTPDPAETIEQAVARQFRAAAPNSILADDRRAARLIARTGSATPFVLPGADTFNQALFDPASQVDYVLVAAAPTGSSPVARLFDLADPEPQRGFIIEARWPGWLLYRHEAASPLLANWSSLRVQLPAQ